MVDSIQKIIQWRWRNETQPHDCHNDLDMPHFFSSAIPCLAVSDNTKELGFWKQEQHFGYWNV